MPYPKEHTPDLPQKGKRGFLKQLLGLGATATVIPIQPVSAQINEQPQRRPGIDGKRFAMVIDLRKCIGCQACTVSCSFENLPPIGQFRNTLLQYEDEDYAGGQPAMCNLPRIRQHSAIPTL